ncbi:hypothetical protein CMO96_04360 [Candidatus Woesebacteria bacterium]|nr:hypothetical protein [Candidatus Woesebacteria bacterium]|tara:strand:+ start:72 stop:275 length:204 start_codon:yes stop_codon:yes gene_type:complete
MLKVILGMGIGAILYAASDTDQWYDSPPTIGVCDNMEESRLKIILEECSRAAMECTWGPENAKEEEW